MDTEEECIVTTRAELVAAYAAWISALRTNPEGFISREENDAMSVEGLAADSADCLIDYLAKADA